MAPETVRRTPEVPKFGQVSRGFPCPALGGFIGVTRSNRISAVPDAASSRRNHGSARARAGFADREPDSEKDVLMNPDVAQSVLPLTSSDLSLLTLFWHAHWIVKAVMIGLLVASVWVWAIAIDKTVLYARTRKAMDRFEQTFWSGESLDDLYRNLASRPNHSMAALFVAAMREWKRSFESGARSFAGLQTRIEKVMEVTIAREIDRLERRLLVLATVGSAGPFIGLFGTVWGIMTSFQSIAASKNTSLAVVAPGIAEALFATALGLIAAIPATIFYNKFAAEVNKQAQRLEGFADEFAAILSRQIDQRG